MEKARLEAVMALAAFGDERAMDVLVNVMTNDREAIVREKAADAIKVIHASKVDASGPASGTAKNTRVRLIPARIAENQSLTTRPWRGAT
jgi:HEAT repeat protein